MRGIGAFSRKVMKSIVGNDDVKITDHEQITEPYCDITAKDTGIQYRGLVSGRTYKVVKPWEVDARK